MINRIKGKKKKLPQNPEKTLRRRYMTYYNDTNAISYTLHKLGSVLGSIHVPENAVLVPYLLLSGGRFIV